MIGFFLRNIANKIETNSYKIISLQARSEEIFKGIDETLKDLKADVSYLQRHTPHGLVTK